MCRFLGVHLENNDNCIGMDWEKEGEDFLRDNDGPQSRIVGRGNISSLLPPLINRWLRINLLQSKTEESNEAENIVAVC